MRRVGATGLCAIAVAALLGAPADGKVVQPVITQGPQPGEPAADLVMCDEPRPMICTQEFRPVCARMRLRRGRCCDC